MHPEQSQAHFRPLRRHVVIANASRSTTSLGAASGANETSTPIGWCYSVVVGISSPGLSSGPTGGPSVLTASRALTAQADTFLHVGFQPMTQPSLSGTPSGTCPVGMS